MNSERSPSKLAYAIAEVVEATSVGRSLLYEEIRAGRLKAFKVGHRTLIATDDLMKWLEAHKRGRHDDGRVRHG